MESNLSDGTFNRLLQDDLGLVKKSARWVPRFLTEEQKVEHCSCAETFKKWSFELGAAFLTSIVTMDESAVSFHTPETKEQSRQWLEKGMPGPLKAKVHASFKAKW